MNDRMARWMRSSLLLSAAGLAIQLVCALAWSPGTFMVFACVGVPLTLAGAGWYGWSVFRFLREKGAA